MFFEYIDRRILGIGVFGGRGSFRTYPPIAIMALDHLIGQALLFLWDCEAIKKKTTLSPKPP